MKDGKTAELTNVRIDGRQVVGITADGRERRIDAGWITLECRRDLGLPLTNEERMELVRRDEARVMEWVATNDLRELSRPVALCPTLDTLRHAEEQLRHSDVAAFAAFAQAHGIRLYREGTLVYELERTVLGGCTQVRVRGTTEIGWVRTDCVTNLSFRSWQAAAP